MREGMRQDSKDGRRMSRVLTTCRCNADRRTREVPTAAAATEAQTGAQTATYTAAQTQTDVNTHTCWMVPDCPTLNP